MINYDKWKLLNENFMISQPLGIKKTNGFLAYNKLHEDEEIEDDDVEDEIEDGMEDDEDGDEDEDEYEDEDMEDEYEDEYEDEDMEDEYEDEDEDEDEGDDGIKDMDDDEYEDDEYEDDEYEDDEYEDEDHEDEDHDETEDEGPMMGRVRSHHHSHDKHLSRPHHEMDTDEIDFAAKASDKMSKMYANCESMEYKMPSMNEWLSSVNGMMFPEELNDYIGKKNIQVNEAVEEKTTGKVGPINVKIDELAEKTQSLTRVEFMSTLRHFVTAFEPKVSGGLPSMANKRLDQVIAEFSKVVKKSDNESEDSESEKKEPSKMKYMKKGRDTGCGMMPKKMKMMPKKMKMSSKNMKSCSSKNMKKSTKR